MAAQMDVMKERKFYPDANSTLRVTYGKAGATPRDAVRFDFYTYLDGVMEKYVPGDLRVRSAGEATHPSTATGIMAPMAKMAGCRFALSLPITQLAETQESGARCLW